MNRSCFLLLCPGIGIAVLGFVSGVDILADCVDVIVGWIGHTWPDDVLCAGIASWIGGAAKGIAGLGSAIWGGIKSGKERKRAQKELEHAQESIRQEQGFNDALFNREYHQDFLQRSESQAALKMLRDRMKRQNDAQAQMSVITGATPELVAKQKELSNQAVGDTVSQIAAHGSSVKDNILNRYQGMRQNFLNQELNIYGQKANLHNQNARQWANLMSNGLNALSSSFTSNENGSSGLVDVLSKVFK